MRKTTSYFLLPVLILFLSGIGESGCTARRVEKGQTLLKKVIIQCDDPAISQDDIYGYLRQKPNRKLFGANMPMLKHVVEGKRRHLLGIPLPVFKDRITNGAGFPFYLAIHNLVNPRKELKREAKRDSLFQIKHFRWEQNPTKRNGKPRKEPKKHRTIGEFLWSIGEAPVIIDSSKTMRTLHQVDLYLDNKGYFNSTVTDTVVYPFFHRNNKKKGIIVYVVKPSTPYTIRNVTWNIKDPNIAYDLGNASDTLPQYCVLKPGMRYDRDTLEKEQSRITTALRNNGYYLFSKDFIHFSMDSTLGTHQMDVKITINKVLNKYDTTYYETNHQRFFVRNIYVKTLFVPTQLHRDDAVYDTIVFNDVHYLRNDTNEKILHLKPDVLSSRISITPGPLYNQSVFDATYNQLIGLRVFRQVIISPEIHGDQLDVTIWLLPVSRQSYTVQAELTNTGSNQGIGGSISYMNTNLFRGAEVLQFLVNGGTEAQQPVNQTQQNSTPLTFNTIQGGTQLSLNIPRDFFPFNVRSYLPYLHPVPEIKRKAQQRRTVLTTSFNYQHRLDYDRSLLNLSYGYTFRYHNYSYWGIFPVELNVVKVLPRAGLLDLLQNSDPLLQYRFTDHLINDFRVTYVFNNQTANPYQKDAHFFKIDLESSGIITRQLFVATHGAKDDLGSYRIDGIPFSEYLRCYADYHYKRNLGHEVIAFRGAVGLGYPLANFPTLPLEKSFYGGGANGIRGWEARTLGPGSYTLPSDQRYAQFGDVQMEYTVEVRFNITKTLKGALFTDGGNIWLLKADPQRPGGEFRFDKFYNDFAFGPGVGLRYDLSFFIIRLDWAFRVRDPAYPVGERWYTGQRPLASNLNFGIGYPF